MNNEDIHKRHQPFGGAHGLVFAGTSILALIRDDLTPSYPGYVDLIGGGRDLTSRGEPETPFETFSREAWEEAGVEIHRRDISHAFWYPSQTDPRFTGVFLVAHLPASAHRQACDGDEGTLVHFPSLSALLARDDFVPAHRRRVEDYARFIGAALPVQVQVA